MLIKCGFAVVGMFARAQNDSTSSAMELQVVASVNFFVFISKRVVMERVVLEIAVADRVAMNYQI